MRPDALLPVVVVALLSGCVNASNPCGGRAPLPGAPGQPCDTGTWACVGPDELRCTDCASGMCTVPAGEFLMGCVWAECLAFKGPRGTEPTDTLRLPTELPRHAVSTGAFEIDRTEVTVRDYQRCSRCGPPAWKDERCNSDTPGREDHPVNCVSWSQAAAYCGSVGKRLCSEAEWEKAARGTDGRTFPWGEEAASCKLAVFDESAEFAMTLSPAGDGCGTGATMAVGSKPAGASPYGALDMAGNVAEWVADDWHRTYAGAPADGRAWCVGDGGCSGSRRAYSRVLRGGSFGLGAHYLRTTSRDWGYADAGMLGPFFVGFRCCR